MADVEPNGNARHAVFFWYIMGRILAVDFGRRRIGLAVCDELQMTTTGLPTLYVRNIDEGIAGVAQVVDIERVEQVVVGLPLNMDGSPGEMARAAEVFAQSLGRICDTPICLFDERLSSAGAQNEMRMMGIKNQKRKGAVDRIAAVLILETYLQHIGR